MSKTYLDDLLDKYPHCMILDSGYPRICRSVLYEGKYCDGSHGYDCYNCWHEEMQEDAPAVPHEMTAREFARDRNRMCLFHFSFCNGCTVLPERMECGEVIHDCPLWTLRDPDKAIAIVEKWAREHPEERSAE